MPRDLRGIANLPIGNQALPCGCRFSDPFSPDIAGCEVILCRSAACRVRVYLRMQVHRYRNGEWDANVNWTERGEGGV